MTLRPGAVSDPNVMASISRPTTFQPSASLSLQGPRVDIQAINGADKPIRMSMFPP